MFHQIINKMANRENWSICPHGMTIDCSEFKEKDIDLIFDFFELHEIHPSLNVYAEQGKSSKTSIVFSISDFKTLFESFESYTYDKDLLEDGILYNPIHETDLEYIQKKLSLKIGENTPNNSSPEKNFLQFINDNASQNLLYRRIFNEFIIIAKENDKAKRPFCLTVNMRDEINPRLDEENAFGIAFYQTEQPYIIIKHPNTTSYQKFISMFLHELRHIIQTEYQLNAFPIIQERIPKICNVMSTLAREAEAKSYDLLIFPSKTKFVSVLKDQKIEEEVDLFIQKKSSPAYMPKLTTAQKIAASLRHIQTESYEKTLQLLCNLHLSSSRFNAYTILRENQIHMNPNIFIELANHIERWKSYYFSRSVYYNRTTRNQFTDVSSQIIKIENDWVDKTGLRLSLSPNHVFSENIAKILGIDSLINTTSQQRPIQLIYQGINNIDTHSLLQLYENEKFSEINKIYTNIQEQNPILPKIQHNRHSKEAAYRYVMAISSMIEGQPTQTILSLLNYSMENRFCVTEWTPPQHKSIKSSILQNQK